MHELNLAQHAMLAGIPKAPSRNNPISGPQAGKDRRNWILGRMRDLGYIDTAAYENASKVAVSAQHHGAQLSFSAHYAAEMARQEILNRYGMGAYTNGYNVYTTIDGNLQRRARSALIKGLITYDERHGYRGPERRLPPNASDEKWRETLKNTAVIAGLEPAVVKELHEEGALVLLTDGSTELVPWENGIAQAAPYRGENRVGPRPSNIEKVLAVGHMIRVARDEQNALRLYQVPAAQSALVSLDPKDGAILSIVGGMGFELSKFNRVTQAMRQPGSNFKPFVYSAALEAGFTAATLINDAPVVLEDRALEDIWRPENDGGKFYGPTRLRWALTKSRNLVSIRLLQRLGADNLINYITQLGFDTADFTPDLSLALGTHAMSPLEVATGYAVLANGGYKVEPYLVARVESLDGEVLYQAEPLTVCKSCEDDAARDNLAVQELSMEQILAGELATQRRPPVAPRVMDERVNFIIDSMLKDVITRGTGRRALVLKRRDIAGKTGTTNGPMDAWFSGYNPEVVTTTWVGFDNYTPLGRKEFGGTAALPIWIDYMAHALAGRPHVERPLPAGVINVRIDPVTGKLAANGQSGTIFEYFREEFVPQQSTRADGQPADGSPLDDLIDDIF
ncbi:MAG: penicillin-binding protein 1A [Bacteroidia bacterium]|jgi:penicillin-binding protein 1A